VRVRRAMIIMASASGTPVSAIAGLVAADEDTVRDVIHLFNARGLAALDPRWAGGRPRRISDEDISVIVAAAITRPEKLGLPFTATSGIGRWRDVLAWLLVTSSRGLALALIDRPWLPAPRRTVILRECQPRAPAKVRPSPKGECRMISSVVVSYRVRPEAVAEHVRLIEAVFEQLHAERPGNVEYKVVRLDDGVSFVHVSSADTPGGSNPLPELAAFKEFSRDSAARVATAPVPTAADIIGSYYPAVPVSDR
jgi:Winged helix-turn helix